MKTITTIIVAALFISSCAHREPVSRVTISISKPDDSGLITGRIVEMEELP